MAQRSIRWVPDSEALSCMSCQKDFSISRRKHHCRLCGGVVCGRCSSNKVKLVHNGTTKSHRVCDECFVSFQPAVGGGTGFQRVGGGGHNGPANGRGPYSQTPAQALLGASAPPPQQQQQPQYQPSVLPYQSSGNGYGSSYGSGGADGAVSPNAHRMLYQSPLLAENPNSGCCGSCVIC